MSRIEPVFAVLFLPTIALCQLPSRRCDLASQKLEECSWVTGSAFSANVAADPSQVSVSGVAAGESLAPGGNAVNTHTGKSQEVGNAFTRQTAPKKQGFHWGRALFESFTLLCIEQAYVVHDDYRWVTVENGVPFNHYWRDYTQSLHTWVHSGWNDGDPNMYGYVGHPIQGAFTDYIQIQNDPRSDGTEFSNTKKYWRSRLRATLWNAVYSTQWNIGPLSEMTVEKYGTKVRPPWNHNGSFPCARNCYTGVGQIDLVMTPVGGLGWMVGEDLLDKNLTRRLEEVTRNHVLIDFTRCGLNPVRAGANMIHGRRPWYRARDASALYFAHHAGKHDGVSQ
jgi:hypothetical protein